MSFHEITCENIYQDLYKLLQPKSMTLGLQYTRRGGAEINPIRSTDFRKPQTYILSKAIQQ